ncbi:hypothetical protein [Mucilaginibacter sp. SG564]|uniref:hypothetical protein n=1 Tax=unclassified Mucilaginibacter TaxID=2617802 RepID=UPI00155728B1|nr:hypothetical protein [Mucilaginibacter sp. SG564]NOW96338.1 hypothetical protein [Mucilaginibacter sp. SG564]
METTTTTTETQQARGVITGNEGAVISLDSAARFTANHRHRSPKGAAISQLFGQVIVNKILAQPGCLAIRIYYANRQQLSGFQKFFVAIGNFFIKTIANADGDMRFVISGVTEDGEDMLPGDMKGETVMSTTYSTNVKTFKLLDSMDDNSLGDDSYPCPGSTGCPKNKLTGG